MSFAIVKLETRHHRAVAKEHWGLTEEQMKGMHVHHRIPRSQGGTNDPSNLYVCSPSFHARVWHGPGANIDFIEAAREGGRKGGKKRKGKQPWNKGKKTGPNPAISEANKRRVWTEEAKEKCKEGGRKNKGNKRPDFAAWLKENTPKRKRDSKGRFL
jgi:hypothetical protein